MKKKTYDVEALEYIAKLSEGGCRDAITMLDKTLSFNKNLTIENVVKALGTVDYQQMMNLTDAVITSDKKKIVDIIETIHMQGKDIKQFVNSYVQFILDVQKYQIGCEDYIHIPKTEDNKDWLDGLEDEDFEICADLLYDMVRLNSSIKWSQSPKYELEAVLLLFCDDTEEE